MKVYTFLIAISLILSALRARTEPEMGITIHCSDSVIQQNIQRIKALAHLRPVPLQINPALPIEAYGTVIRLSQSSFDKQIVGIGEEVLSIGPTYSDPTIRVNKNFLSFLQQSTRFPKTIFNFALAHEMGHHLERVHNLNIDHHHTVGGYSFQSLKGNLFVNEVYLHAHIDCTALSLMKNAKMEFDLESIIEALSTFRDECIYYRGKNFCERAHEIRLEHIKSWFKN